MSPMRKRISCLLAVAMLGATPALAQYNSAPSSSWDRNAFWEGAPSGISQRVDFIQRRIDRGVSDGTLTRREANDLNRELATIRSDARRGRLTADRQDRLQARLDNVSSRVRWNRQDGQRYGNNDSRYNDPRYADGRYDDRFNTQYDATRYYRDDPRYTERTLSANDEVYRGSDGRYYCKRSDGTTGLIIGGLGGGVLGNVIDGGRNRVAGTLIGGALGALLGKSVDQNSNQYRCR
jgi:hypothetical protein